MYLAHDFELSSTILGFVPHCNLSLSTSIFLIVHANPRMTLFESTNSSNEHLNGARRLNISAPYEFKRKPSFQRNRSSSFAVNSSSSWKYRRPVPKVAVGNALAEGHTFESEQMGTPRIQETRRKPKSSSFDSFRPPAPFGRQQSENWHSFHKRFQTKKANKPARSNGSGNSFLRMLNRVFVECTRPRSCEAYHDDTTHWVESEVNYGSEAAYVQYTHRFEACSADQKRRVDLIE